MKHFLRVISVVVSVFFISSTQINAQTQFTHPGGLHTQTDLDRMKAKVTAGETPWVECWNQLIADSRAQTGYGIAPRANMGSSRQRAQQDATAMYLNAVRWYVSGDTAHAEAAVRIANGWSAVVNQVPTGTDIPGLIGIPISTFAIAGEILRLYPGWQTADFERYKAMFRNYLYPVCHDFLVRHNNTCVDYYWANWDACNVLSLISMGILIDDRAIYNEGIEYFKNGEGAGSIKNAVYYIHPDGLGQWQESGRDHSHNMLGLGFLSYAAQVAWNQGDDLFGYDNNRLLAGAEYVAKANLWKPVPFKFYDNCDNVNNSHLSINARGTIGSKPIFELLYNHYVVSKGLNAPNVQAIAELLRPEYGDIDHLGYGSLMFTLDAVKSPYPAAPPPPTPTNITATAGVGRVIVEWDRSGDTASGYEVKRATNQGGPYSVVASWGANTTPFYHDWSVTNGTRYYYVVAAKNRNGTSSFSSEVSATPHAAGQMLPAGWFRQDIGVVATPGTATFSNVGNNTFIITGSGTSIGGVADSHGFTGGLVTGDTTFIARVYGQGGAMIRSGLTMREKLDPDSKAINVTRGDAGWRFAKMGVRAATGDNMNYVDGNKFTWLSVWFKLERKGNTFKAYQSYDGIDWYEMHSAEVSMTSTFYVGFITCSGSSAIGVSNSMSVDNVSIVGGGIAPQPASTLTATAIGTHQIKLSWTASPNAPGYKVMRSATPGGPYTTVSYGTTETTYIDTGLDWNLTYYYIVTATNLAGESVSTNEASAKTPEPVTPIAPAELTASAGDATVTLNWNASYDATSYTIKRSNSFNGNYAEIATASTTSYRDTGLVNGIVYYYKVKASNYKGSSADSLSVGAKPTGRQHGYWAFDEASGTIAVDFWGGQNGITASGALFTPGKVNNGVKLDGTANGYVLLPSGIVSTLNDFTIASWVRMDVAANWIRLFDFGSGTTNNMFLTLRNGANGKVRFEVYSGGVSQQVNTTHTMAAGAWTHIAVTLSGNLGIVYINGIEVGRNENMTLKPSTLEITTQNYIGKSQWNDPLLNGIVDDFRIYNKSLTVDEIGTLLTQSTYTAVVNHAPTLNGSIKGSVQVLSSEDIILNGNADIAGDLLVAGSPNVTINGHPTIDGILDSTGNSTPSNYRVTINGGASIRNLIRRTPPISWESITSLIPTTDVQNIIVNSGESLTLSPGAYGNVTINGGGSITVSGSDPIILTGNLILNGGAIFNGYVVAPNGTVIINGNAVFTGRIIANCMTINGSGLLVDESIAKPKGLNATAADTKVTLTWITPSSATSVYTIKRATAFVGPYVEIGTSVTNSYSDVGLTNGTTYYYVVSASNDFGSSDDSSTIEATPESGRVSYLSFNVASGAISGDSWGGLNATMASGATLVEGRVNNAVKLDGTTNGYVTLPSGIASSLTNFTIASWVKLDATANWIRLFDFGNSANVNMFLTLRNSDNTYVRFGITTNGRNSEQRINTTYVMPIEEWVHVAVTLSGNVGIIYINGVEIGRNDSMTLNPSSLGITTLNYIGKSQYSADSYLNGIVDEFYIFNKALTAEELATLLQ